MPELVCHFPIGSRAYALSSAPILHSAVLSLAHVRHLCVITPSIPNHRIS